jgi:putative drug exporter of the RND superfamily
VNVVQLSRALGHHSAAFTLMSTRICSKARKSPRSTLEEALEAARHLAGCVKGSALGPQEFGLGLSVAILLDATVVHAIIVPGVMKLLGDWNWYLPARLRRALRVPAEPVSGT